MKPEILVKGNYTEDRKGNISINGWILGSNSDQDPYSLGELKEIALEIGTYSKVDHIEVEPLENFGIVHRGENGEIESFQGFNTL